MAQPEQPDRQYGPETYLSPFTQRYGSPEMRELFSERHKWLAVRDVWIAVARAQHGAGLVTDEQLDDLVIHRDDLSVDRIHELEKQTGHDVAAAIAHFHEVAPVGGEILHMGMTSEDVLSNMEMLEVREALGMTRGKLVRVLEGFAGRIEVLKDVPTMGFTHLQTAEPTTYGYRFAKYAQDLLVDLHLLDAVYGQLKGKGIKGAVGTAATFAEMLEGTDIDPAAMEADIMTDLGLPAVTIADQTYPRKFALLAVGVLEGIGQSLHRFALDMQQLSSSPLGEVSEPRRKGQIGSSAMPHKQNPIQSENICALTELLPGIRSSAWMTASFGGLERTLRDSAGKRVWLSEGFLIADEALTRADKLIRGLEVHENVIRENFKRFGPFAATEVVLGLLVARGMDRQKAHALLVGHAEVAVETVREGRHNPLELLIFRDRQITDLLSNAEIHQAFESIATHVGIAPQACTNFLQNELIPALH